MFGLTNSGFNPFSGTYLVAAVCQSIKLNARMKRTLYCDPSTQDLQLSLANLKHFLKSYRFY